MKAFSFSQNWHCTLPMLPLNADPVLPVAQRGWMLGSGACLLRAGIICTSQSLGCLPSPATIQEISSHSAPGPPVPLPQTMTNGMNWTEQRASAGGAIGHLPDELGHAFSCTSFPVQASRERIPAAEGSILLEVMLGDPQGNHSAGTGLKPTVV